MRLLNTSSLQLEQFLEQPPPYAILSHTWADGEVLFSDMQNGTAHTKKGFDKVVKCCELAAAKRHNYLWIDTCCIDKSSSAELSEAINSMFSYYENARVCYVYLDFAIPGGSMNSALRKARWMYRGWTLQELLAPAQLYFYDQFWNYCGSRASHARTIAELTGIDIELLGTRHKLKRLDLSHFSVAERMSWVSKRHTTRPEDIAYCLFGLFSVNLPTLYGEGASHAFRRLQEEIIKNSTDLSILAWTTAAQAEHTYMPSLKGALALSPAWFARSNAIKLAGIEVEPFSITNKGLRVQLPLIMHPSDIHKLACTAVLSSLFFEDDPVKSVGIELESFPSSPGGNVWYRRTGFQSQDGVLWDVHPVEEEAVTRAKLSTIYIGLNYRSWRL